MKNLIRLLQIVILSMILISTTNAYNGPTEEGVTPIGWSDKGDIFAYEYFLSSYQQDPTDILVRIRYTKMTVKIQNMVTDEVFFVHSKRWKTKYDTYSKEDGPAIQLPRDAWNEISEIINKELNHYKIKNGNIRLNKFLPSEDWNFKAEIRPFDMEPGYGLYIKYLDGREKKITSYSEELDVETGFFISGFVWSPYKNE